MKRSTEARGQLDCCHRVGKESNCSTGQKDSESSLMKYSLFKAERNPLTTHVKMSPWVWVKNGSMTKSTSEGSHGKAVSLCDSIR